MTPSVENAANRSHVVLAAFEAVNRHRLPERINVLAIPEAREHLLRQRENWNATRDGC
jgi:hypothetical protein